ncbi:MAG: hypothetical protein OCD01_11800 [Fibrobacterales bacterium]
MNSILTLKIIIWAAPIIGVLLGGIVSLIANVKLHELEKIESMAEKQVSQQFQNNSLSNQNKILEGTETVIDNADGISLQIKENIDLTLKLKKQNAEQFEKSNRPTLNIIEDIILPPGKSNNYHITVKNFGKSTATDVSMYIEYLNPKGTVFVKRVKELTPNNKIIFNVPIVPDMAFSPINKNWEKERQQFINNVINGNATINFQVYVEYTWNNKTYKTREYLFIHETPSKVTMW